MPDPVTIGLAAGSLGVASIGLLEKGYELVKGSPNERGSPRMQRNKGASRHFEREHIEHKTFSLQGNAQFTYLPNGAFFASGSGPGDRIEYAGTRTTEYNPQLLKGQQSRNFTESYGNQRESQFRTQGEIYSQQFQQQLQQQEALRQRQLQLQASMFLVSQRNNLLQAPGPYQSSYPNMISSGMPNNRVWEICDSDTETVQGKKKKWYRS